MKLVTLLLLTFSTYLCFAQSDDSIIPIHSRKKTIFVEGLGSGIFYSIKFDMRFNKSNKGLGGSLGGCKLGNLYTFPIEVNYLIGKKKHFIELGAGITYTKGETKLPFQEQIPIAISLPQYIYFGRLAYRLQPQIKGLSFQVSYTPAFSKDYNFSLWGGLGIGYSF